LIERDREDAVRGLAKVEQCMAEFEQRWAAVAHRTPSARASRRVEGKHPRGDVSSTRAD
jgi:hypothetical protein